ncbi:hypothetical protein BH23ACT9_BH23ACT9_35000 [soil metagenome]
MLETGEALEIKRKGRRLRIVPDTRPSRTDGLVAHPGTVVGDLDDLVHLDWSGEWQPADRS